MTGARDDEGSSVARAYDRWAATYDDDANATRDLDAVLLRQSGLPLENADVIEIGCGTGKNTIWLAERARHVTALDFSAGMLARARARLAATPFASRVQFVEHDVRTAWPLDDDSAEVVTVNLVLEHVRDVRPVFEEIARVLRSGGRAWICELHPYRQWRGGQAQFTDAESGERERVPAFVHSTSEFVGAALSAGLRLVRLDEAYDAGALDAPPRLLVLELSS